MLKKERHDYIMRQINLHNRVLSSDLIIQLNVSEDTIRRDLNELAETGTLFKVHGGALSKSYHAPFNDRHVYARDIKIELAKKAALLIKDGMTILTGGGTSIIELVKHIPENINATFFTISPMVAVELAEYPHIDIILIGGQFSRSSQVTYGANVINQLNDIKVDLCFLGTNAIDINEGLTDTDWEIIQLKKTMIKCASKVVILCISEKLNTTQRLRISNLNEIDYLITELEPNDMQLDAYRNFNINIL